MHTWNKIPQMLSPYSILSYHIREEIEKNFPSKLNSSLTISAKEQKLLIIKTY